MIYRSDKEALEELERITGIVPDEAQRKVLEHKGGMCILSTAGSGKTEILTQLTTKRILTGEIKDISRVLLTTYSVGGREELEERINKLLKQFGIKKKIEVRTLHSSYLFMLTQAGYKPKLMADFERMNYIKQACNDVSVYLDEEELSILDSLLSYQINNMMVDEVLYRQTDFTLDISFMQYKQISQRFRELKIENGVNDFDDLQMLVLNLLRTNVNARELFRSLWDYYYIDEFQDISKIQFEILKMLLKNPQNLVVIGDDDQCLVGGTQLLSQDGYKAIEEVKEGDSVLSGIGHGEVDYRMTHHSSVKDYEGKLIQIKTAKGYSLKGTPEHVGFIRMSEDMNRGYYVYLAYRRDFGFRLGYTTDSLSIESVLQKDKGHRAWIISHREKVEEVVKLAESYHKRYGLPLECFECEGAKQRHEDLYTLEKGYKLLKELGKSFNYPHYRFNIEQGDKVVYSNVFSGEQKNEKGVYQGKMFICDKEDKLCKPMVHNIINEKRYYLQQLNGECEETQKDLVVVEQAQLTEKVYSFMNLGNMIEGMLIPVYENGKLIEDRIVEVVEVCEKCKVYDVSVPETYNFVANNIVVHNCIYEWRGADPNIIQNICGYYDISQFVLGVNYRCSSEIVDRAAQTIENNNNRVSKTIQAHTKGGKVVIESMGNSMYEISAGIADYVISLLNQGVKPDDIAILCRNNNHGIVIQDMLSKYTMIRSVKHMRFGANTIAYDISLCVKYVRDNVNYQQVVHLWKMVKYLKTDTCRLIGKVMRNNGCSLLVALKSILTSLYDIEFEDDIQVLPFINANNYTGFKYLKDETINGLYHFYLDATDRNMSEMDRVMKLIERYLSHTIGFLYKKPENKRLVISVADYIMDLITEKGLADYEAHFKMSEMQSKLDNNFISNAINICTMNGSKGKQWKYVILVADDNLTLPSFTLLREMIEDGHSVVDLSNYIEQERRLHYVAMTRAKEELRIFTTKGRESVYLLESIGLLEKAPEDRVNKHIIEIVQKGGYSKEFKREIEEALKAYKA